MFSFSIAAVTFGVVFIAELPDKTALAGLMLGTRYRASYVFAGAAAAFAVHVGLALAAGSLLALFPQRLLQGIVAVLFLAGAAVLLLFKRDEDDGGHGTRTARNASFWRVAGAGFSVVLVAEFGDLTQIMTANLAARYADPAAVGVGALLALWAVAGLAIVGGKTLLRVLPMRLITKAAACVMLAMAAFSLYEAATG